MERLTKGLWIMCAIATGASASEGMMVYESAREIPVAYNVDVVVVGGTTAAAAAATAATKAGASVFLAAPRPYLGEDMCATLRLQRPDDSALPQTPLTRKLFPGTKRTTTPLHVKKVLDGALVDAGVTFLLGSVPTDILRDDAGRPAGVVIANRAGRQAVVAKVIVDATERATVARLAGARSRPWSRGKQVFQRITLAPGTPKNPRTIVHDLAIDMPTGDAASFAEAEQAARDQTYTEGQYRASAFLFQIPPDPLHGQVPDSDWSSSEPDLGHFRPQGTDAVYVLSGCADVPRDAAERLLQPCALTAIGTRVGIAAARDATLQKPSTSAHVANSATAESDGRDVKECLDGPRPVSGDVLGTVPSAARGVPVWGTYDVIVIGGGTAGAPAAIAAARRGAKVLIVEYLEGLGGVGTLGLIGMPYHGRRAGFSKEIPFPDKTHNIEYKMEWYRREARKAGADIWFGALGCGAVVHGTRVVGAMVATTHGRGAILADVVIDATGNADTAIAAGADYMYGATTSDIALQGTGLPMRPLGKNHVNSDYLLVDETDMVDVWRTLVGTRETMPDHVFDAGTLIQTRERRSIVGDHVLAYLDQIAGRTYPDSIVVSSSDYDAHGYPSLPIFALLPHDAKSRLENHPAPGGTSYTPYRCLLPKGLDGILVLGLGISMERDASAMIRMQLDLSNQGYAAGVAASMAATGSISPRNIDVKALQKHLVEIGSLPANVLTHKENFPLSETAVTKAIATLADADNPAKAGNALAVVLLRPEIAKPLLKDACNLEKLERWRASAMPPGQLTYAKILGILGDPVVVPSLINALNNVTAWDDKIFQGHMAEYAHLPTPVDGLVFALGYTRDQRALPAILAKLEQLDAEVPLSHHRSVALALERIGDPSAAAPLAELLAKPGMRGHAMTALEPLHDKARDKRRRTGPLREIVLARVLYRCGDHNGLGETILREYLHDIRGLFARHAEAVLRAGRDFRPPETGR